jgi:excisionase family DNA binding protein
MAAAGRDHPPGAADSLAGQLTLADWERELADDAQLTTETARSEASQPPPATKGADTKTPSVSRPSAVDDGLNERHLLTVAEVGRATGLSVNAVYRAIWNGELRASKLRGRLRIQDVDVDSWVDAGRLDIEPGRRRRRPRPRTPAARSRPGRGLRELLQAAQGPDG